MSKLPKPKRLPPVAETQRHYLAKWLAMRRFEQAWGDDFGVTEKPLGTRPDVGSDRDSFSAIARAPFDAKVEVGDIRLLAGDLTADHRFPCYVAVVGPWDFGFYLAIPFSPYSVPSVTGELATGREHFSLAVLQCWNAVIAPAAVLARSWIADRLSKVEVADAMAGFHHVLAGTPLPGHLAGRVGAPILSPADPRIAYQTEETEAFRAFRQACAAEIKAQEAGNAFKSLVPPDSPGTRGENGVGLRSRRKLRLQPSIAYPWSVFRPDYEAHVLPKAADDGRERTPCLLAQIGDGETVAESVLAVALWAECRGSFQPMRAGADFCNNWFIETNDCREPIRALVYIESREAALGNGMVCSEPGGIRVVMNEVDLAPDEVIGDPSALRLVILMAEL